MCEMNDNMWKNKFEQKERKTNIMNIWDTPTETQENL